MTINQFSQEPVVVFGWSCTTVLEYLAGTSTRLTELYTWKNWCYSNGWPALIIVSMTMVQQMVSATLKERVSVTDMTKVTHMD
jgi:hypothetical protein